MKQDAILTKANVQKVLAILAVALASGGGVTAIGSQKTDTVTAQVAVLEAWQDEHTIEDRTDRADDRIERRLLAEKLEEINKGIATLQVQVARIESSQGKQYAIQRKAQKDTDYAYYNQRDK